MTRQITIPAMALSLLFLNLSSSGQDASSSITSAELKDHIYFLASDYMGGRIATSPEYEIAAQYVAAQFAAGGLTPLECDSGHMDGYFQKVPFKKTVYRGDFKWTVKTGEGDKEFVHGEDFKVFEGRMMTDKSQEVVFAGFGIQEPEFGWDDYRDIDVAGKAVIIMGGVPEKKGKAVLPDSLNDHYGSMSGFQGRIFSLFMKGPSSIIVLPDEQVRAMMPFEHFPSKFRSTRYVYKGAGKGPRGFHFPMIYMITDEVVEAIFKGQKISPAGIRENGIRRYKCYQLEDVSLTADCKIAEETLVHSKNVVAMVKGTDPELSREYITVGAHLDHVAHQSGEIANGADDNASGSAGVIEIAEAVAMDPPRRSVVFITYTAEEMGLHGSHYFVNSGPLATEDIRFNVNLDMIGRTTAENAETRSHYVRGNGKYGKKLEPFISEINEETVNWPLIYNFGPLQMGSSDHASYHNVGIPSFFFFSGMHEDLHQPGDDPEKIEYDKAEQIARLAYAITMKLANMDQVPDFEEKSPESCLE